MAVFMRRSMHEFMDSMKDTGLSMPQLTTLIRLHYHGPCPISGIGDDLGVTTAAASQMVDRLVHLGLLDRTEAPGRSAGAQRPSHQGRHQARQARRRSPGGMDARPVDRFDGGSAGVGGQVHPLSHTSRVGTRIGKPTRQRVKRLKVTHEPTYA